MEAACNLLIKEGILHRVEDIRIHAEGKLTEVSGAFVGIQQLVDSFRIIGCRLFNFAVLNFKADILIGETLLLGDCVIGDIAVHGILYRRRINLSVRNVHLAVAFDRADAFDGELQICSRAFDVDLVGFVQKFFERVHGFAHLFVVKGADIVEEVGKGLLAGSG